MVVFVLLLVLVALVAMVALVALVALLTLVARPGTFASPTCSRTGAAPWST